jgi:hypothetical protein
VGDVSTVDCLFCGDPCDVFPNGAYCGDCSVYGYRQDNGRWRVRVPLSHVPWWPVDDNGVRQWRTIGITVCEPHPDALAALFGGPVELFW